MPSSGSPPSCCSPLPSCRPAQGTSRLAPGLVPPCPDSRSARARIPPGSGKNRLRGLDGQRRGCYHKLPFEPGGLPWRAVPAAVFGHVEVRASRVCLASQGAQDGSPHNLAYVLSDKEARRKGYRQGRESAVRVSSLVRSFSPGQDGPYLPLSSCLGQRPWFSGATPYRL